VDALALLYRAHFGFGGARLATAGGEDTSAAYGLLGALLNLLELAPPPTHLAVVFDAAGKTFRRGPRPPARRGRRWAPGDTAALVFTPRVSYRSPGCAHQRGMRLAARWGPAVSAPAGFSETGPGLCAVSAVIKAACHRSGAGPALLGRVRVTRAGGACIAEAAPPGDPCARARAGTNCTPATRASGRRCRRSWRRRCRACARCCWCAACASARASVGLAHGP